MNPASGLKKKTKKSILIVDDKNGVRESLRLILKPYYEVHTAANGDEALQCIKKEEIDLVTLDLKMPGMSGMEVLQEIKKIKEDVEVIVVTAFGTPSNAGEALFYGAGDFIVKPFDVSDVTAKVNKSLQRRLHSLKIKNLIQEIKDLILLGENTKEEKLLGLSKNLCEALERGEPSTPSGEEVLDFKSEISRFIQTSVDRTVKAKS